MTTQVDLEKIWALTGGAVDPDILTPGKYENGWVVEIPTYEHFNYVLQNSTKNILVLAEQGHHNWLSGISYVPGATVLASDGNHYTCKAATSLVDPVADTAGSFWVKGKKFGTGGPGDLVNSQGIYIDNVNPRAGGNVWDGNDITIDSTNPIIAMNITGASDNWALANITGEMCVVNLGAATLPDAASIAITEARTHRLFHEGHAPTQAEVSGTIPDAPADGKGYARLNNNWVVVTTTSVSTEPPPPVAGNGAGWYNLTDGQFYVDIDDGDSSQWVPGNPPVIPSIPMYESPQQAISGTGGTITSLAHSLQSRPTNIEIEYVCTTAENGYAIGDRVTNLSWGGVGVFTDNDTHVKMITATTAPTFINKTTGADATANRNNWNVIIRAW